MQNREQQCVGWPECKTMLNGGISKAQVESDAGRYGGIASGVRATSIGKN